MSKHSGPPKAQPPARNAGGGKGADDKGKGGDTAQRKDSARAAKGGAPTDAGAKMPAAAAAQAKTAPEPAPAPATATEAPASKEKAPAPARAAPASDAPAAKAGGAATGKVLLVAWKGSPAAAWAEDLEKAGYEVALEDESRITAFQYARDEDPIAVVIDLSTKTKDGMTLANTLDVTSATRGISVLFAAAGGEDGHAGAKLKTAEDVLSALGKL